MMKYYMLYAQLPPTICMYMKSRHLENFHGIDILLVPDILSISRLLIHNLFCTFNSVGQWMRLRMKFRHRASVMCVAGALTVVYLFLSYTGLMPKMFRYSLSVVRVKLLTLCYYIVLLAIPRDCDIFFG